MANGSAHVPAYDRGVLSMAIRIRPDTWTDIGHYTVPQDVTVYPGRGDIRLQSSDPGRRALEKLRQYELEGFPSQPQVMDPQEKALKEHLFTESLGWFYCQFYGPSGERIDCMIRVIGLSATGHNPQVLKESDTRELGYVGRETGHVWPLRPDMFGLAEDKVLRIEARAYENHCDLSEIGLHLPVTKYRHGTEKWQGTSLHAGALETPLDAGPVIETR